MVLYLYVPERSRGKMVGMFISGIGVLDSTVDLFYYFLPFREGNLSEDPLWFMKMTVD